jgi:hypothetical protein
MHEFHGDLSIGGMRLTDLHGELVLEEHPVPDSSDWVLSGRLTIRPQDQAFLQCNRQYRLQLDDGRAGPVVVSRMGEPHDDSLVLEFEPVMKTCRSG